jgi:hypothetical protein
MKLQELHDEKRKQYLAHEISHSEFYLWLAGEIGVNSRMIPVDAEHLAKSTDEHLNDIPLALWDRQDPIIRSMAGRHGMRAWSLSDTVCVLKAVAKKERARLLSAQSAEYQPSGPGQTDTTQ